MKMTIKEMCLVSLFTALAAAGAFIKVPIPVIPFTLQILFTTLAGALLGARLGALSVGLYIILGLMGLPIFANGGGIAYIFKPTFGYLIGFCVGAYVTGKIAHATKNPSFKRLLCANLVGILCVYAVGLIYFYGISNFYLGKPIGWWPLFLSGFLIPIPGDLVLCGIATIIADRLLPVIRK